MSAKKCAKEGCNCTAPEGEKFCSPQCKDTKNMMTLECHCGHPGCSQKL
jgi:hypothetical protein